MTSTPTLSLTTSLQEPTVSVPHGVIVDIESELPLSGATVLTASVQAPTVITAANATYEVPAAQALTAGLQTPSVQIDGRFAATELSLTATVQTPSLIISGVATPAVQTLTASLQEPSYALTGDIVKSPSVFQLAASLPTAGIQTDGQLDATTLVLTTAVQSPSLRVDGLVTPSVLTITSSIPAPGYTLTGDILKTPGAFSLTATSLAPSFQTLRAAELVTVTALTQAPSLRIDDQVNPSVQGLTVSAPAPTVSLEGNALYASSVFSLTASLQTSTQKVIQAPSLLSFTVSTPSLSLLLSSNLAISPRTLTAVIPAPEVWIQMSKGQLGGHLTVYPRLTGNLRVY